MHDRPALRAASVALVALLALSCTGNGNDGEEAAENGDAGGKSAAPTNARPSRDEKGLSLSIVAPENGADVESPVTVEVSVPVALGQPGSDFHLHVVLDGRTDGYQVVTTKRFEIDLPAGQHTITVLLRKPDHSPAGARARITVDVAAFSDTPHDNGGYDY